jgi:hypothetical protein
LPIWMCPVGDGAKRTMGLDMTNPMAKGARRRKG